MTVTSTPITSAMTLAMDNGTGASGKQLKINRSIKNIKPAAADEDIYEVAQGILALQDKTNLSVQRNDTAELEEE